MKFLKALLNHPPRGKPWHGALDSFFHHADPTIWNTVIFNFVIEKDYLLLQKLINGLGILIKGVGLEILWDSVLIMVLLGSTVFGLGVWRFRRQIE